MGWLSRNLAKLGTGDWFGADWDTDYEHTTPAESLMNAGGVIVSKTMQHVTDGAATDNLFIVSGAVEITGLYGKVMAIGGAVGTADTMTNLKIELFPGPVDITLANSDLVDHGTVGTFIIKDAEDSVKMYVSEADVPRYHEGPVSKVFQGGIIVAETGTTTYIRASYTGDANTDITIMWHVRYIPLHPATDGVTAV